LASLAHLRVPVSEIYREAEKPPYRPPTPWWWSSRSTGKVRRPSNASIDVAECMRIVFRGGDVLGRIGPRRAAAFVGRNPNLPDEVETVRSLITRWRLDSEEPQLVRIWIEGLPGSVEWAGRVLDELARWHGDRVRSSIGDDRAHPAVVDLSVLVTRLFLCVVDMRPAGIRATWWSSSRSTRAT
jgi:hypothetical protein